MVGDGVGTITVGEPATGAAATTSSSTFAPTWIRSPPTRITGPEIRVPFTIVPPEDPRSSSTARPSWVGVRAACIRDTDGSVSRNSASRPIVSLPSTVTDAPASGPERTMSSMATFPRSRAS